MLAEHSKTTHPVPRSRVRKVPQLEITALCSSNKLETSSKEFFSFSVLALFDSWNNVIAAVNQPLAGFPSVVAMKAFDGPFKKKATKA